MSQCPGLPCERLAQASAKRDESPERHPIPIGPADANQAALLNLARLAVRIACDALDKVDGKPSARLRAAKTSVSKAYAILDEFEVG